MQLAGGQVAFKARFSGRQFFFQIFKPGSLICHLCFAGGQNDVLTTEVLTDSGWENTPTVLPTGMFVTCMVAIDDDNFFVRGGYKAT